MAFSPNMPQGIPTFVVGTIPVSLSRGSGCHVEKTTVDEEEQVSRHAVPDQQQEIVEDVLVPVVDHLREPHKPQRQHDAIST